MRRTTTGPVLVIAVKVIVDDGDEDVWKADDDDDDVAPMNTKKKRHLIDASVEIGSMVLMVDGDGGGAGAGCWPAAEMTTQWNEKILMRDESPASPSGQTNNNDRQAVCSPPKL